MSLNKSATRRLGLLAGSSILAAFAGVVLSPTAAMAQATCTSPAAPSGNGTGAVVIAAGTYDPGITCTFIGTMATVSTAGAVTVSTAAGGDGINLSATGADAINWNSTAGALMAGVQTNGPLIDASSVTGAISINTAAITATAAGTTYGIRAVASGAGAVTITRTTSGQISNNVAGGEAAIWAQSGGGNVSVTTNSTTAGRRRGILAQTSGSGTVAVSVAGAVGASTVDGIAGLITSTGTGSTSIAIASGTVEGGAGVAIRSTSASTSASSAVNIQNTGGVVNGRVDFSGVTAGGVTFNNTGSSTFNGRWTASGASVFGAGNDTVTMSGIATNTTAAGTVIDLAGGNDTWNVSTLLVITGTTMDFGAGADAFNMSGRLAMNGLTLNNLETFNNSGVIYMGGTTGTATDLAANDVFRMTSGTFTGSGSGRVVMDVVVGGAGQEGCAVVTTADCLDLRGASTSGMTILSINNVNPNDTAQGGLDLSGITLVDVGGSGASAAGHFVLDPGTEGYFQDPSFGPGLGRPGLFFYGLRYDPETQRHALVGLPRSPVLEYAMLTGAAQSIWHLTAETVTDRQTDLHRRSEGGEVWLRAAGEYTKRDTAVGFESFGDTLLVDTGHKLYAGTIIGGMDLVSGHSGGFDYIAGAQIGYVASSFDLNASETSGRFSGATGGVYGSIWNDRYFLDSTFNMNGLTLDYDSPGLGSKTNTYTTAFGARLDGGMRFGLAEGLAVEPLATVAFVRTGFEEISLSGGEIRPDDAMSRRAALGLRLAGTLGGEGLSATYFVTGRAWNEFDGDSEGVVNNPGADLPFADEFSGGFGETEAGVNLYNAAGTVSGFLASGVKWKDGYSAVDLSLGMRLRW